MRTLLLALAAAGFVTFTLTSYSADEPYTAKPPIDKPGRAVDAGEKPYTAKSPLDKPGRAADEEKPYTAKSPTDKPGRAADAGEKPYTAKSPSDKPGRAADEESRTRRSRRRTNRVARPMRGKSPIRPVADGQAGSCSR